jgi:uncharacterized protein YqiB (DUF1249 family)
MTKTGNIFFDNYKKMKELGFFEGLNENKGYIKLISEGFMDLVLENYAENVITMTHYYEQNGDLCCDPEMTIRIIHDKEYVETLTYQDSITYQNVYTEDGKIYPRLSKSLNEFLGMWLTNIKHQGFKYEKEEK